MSRASFKSWLGSWQEWGSIILLFLTLEIAIRSIEQANWIKPQPSLTLILTLAVLAGLLLSKSRLHGALIYSIAIVLGAVITVWQAANLLPPSETMPRVNQLLVALWSVWQTIIMAKPSDSTIHFAIFLILSTWVIGYVSTWFTLRKQNAWVAVSLGAAIILINLSNLTEKYYTFFLLYLLAAMLLLSQTCLVKHHYWFKKYGITYPNRGMIYFVATGLCLGILAISIAWHAPEIRYNRLVALIDTKMPGRENIENYWSNFFAEVTRRQPLLKSQEQERLLFGHRFNRTEDVQFVVTAKGPRYWRTRMYDTYTYRGWTSSEATQYISSEGTSGTGAGRSSKRSMITYSVLTKVKTDILLTAGEFISSNTPAWLRSLPLRSFDINLVQSWNDSSLPPEVASLVRSLRAAQSVKGDLSLNEIKQLLPADLTITGIGPNRDSPTEANYRAILAEGQLATIQLARTPIGADDTIAVFALYFLKPGGRYTVSASISSATSAELSEAGTDYPPQVTDYYLQLPRSLPERVRRLSERVTREAKSPYDKALAIKQYLAKISYTLDIKAPPLGADGVDDFLFNQLSGDCVPFASAAVVMLRSIGVPSRLATGYLPGEWDEATGISTIRAKDSHAWPEVYFPGYGWVEFEVTPVISDTEGVEPELTDSITDKNAVVAQPDVRLERIVPLAFISIILLVLTLRLAIPRQLERFTGPVYASDVYARMCFLASLLKLGPKLQQTPLEYCAKLASVFPPQAKAFDNIAQAYLESRFSPRKELALRQKEGLLNSWRDVYPLLLKRLFHMKRLLKIFRD